MTDLKNYYASQLEKVSDQKAGDYSRQLQIKNNASQTNWMALNDESATEIVNFLKSHYNVKEA